MKISRAYFYYAIYGVIVFLAVAIFRRMYFWIAEQVLILIMLMGYFPALQRVPILRHIDDSAAKVRNFYRDNPRYLSGVMVALRFVPFVNYFVFWREIRLMMLIFILSLPVDILIESTWNFVVYDHTLSFLGNREFWGSVFNNTYYSAAVVPVIVMLVIGKDLKRMAMEEERAAGNISAS